MLPPTWRPKRSRSHNAPSSMWDLRVADQQVTRAYCDMIGRTLPAGPAHFGREMVRGPQIDVFLDFPVRRCGRILARRLRTSSEKR